MHETIVQYLYNGYAIRLPISEQIFDQQLPFIHLMYCFIDFYPRSSPCNIF